MGRRFDVIALPQTGCSKIIYQRVRRIMFRIAYVVLVRPRTDGRWQISSSSRRCRLVDGACPGIDSTNCFAGRRSNIEPGRRTGCTVGGCRLFSRHIRPRRDFSFCRHGRMIGSPSFSFQHGLIVADLGGAIADLPKDAKDHRNLSADRDV